MSQLTLTPEEDVLVLSAVRAKYAQVLSAYSFEDPALVTLLAKIEAQLTPAPVVEVVEESVVEEPAPKAKKSKAAAE